MSPAAIIVLHLNFELTITRFSQFWAYFTLHSKHQSIFFFDVNFKVWTLDNLKILRGEGFICTPNLHHPPYPVDSMMMRPNRIY